MCLNVDVCHVSGWPSLLCDPVIWARELLICTCSMISFSWGWLIWAIALPITWCCRLACASYMLNFTQCSGDAGWQSQCRAAAVFEHSLFHIHSSDPVIDLKCQYRCNLYPVSTVKQWNPARQLSLSASSASLSSGHLFPGSVSFCQVSGDASNQRHYWINGLLHKVSLCRSRVWTWCQKGSWGKKTNTHSRQSCDLLRSM